MFPCCVPWLRVFVSVWCGVVSVCAVSVGVCVCVAYFFVVCVFVSIVCCLFVVVWLLRHVAFSFVPAYEKMLGKP